MPAASISVTRSLEWIDTDASGIWHYSTVIRFFEHAELELHRRLGTLDEVFGAAPRARLEIDFRRPVRFGDPVETTCRVDAVGRTSITYGFVLATDGATVAEGVVVAVFVDDTGRPREIGDHLRSALLEGGPLD